MKRKIRMPNINYPLVQETFQTLSPGVATIIKCFILNYERFKEQF